MNELYVSPSVEILNVMVEKGFEGSAYDPEYSQDPDDPYVVPTV